MLPPAPEAAPLVVHRRGAPPRPSHATTRGLYCLADLRAAHERRLIYNSLFLSSLAVRSPRVDTPMWVEHAAWCLSEQVVWTTPHEQHGRFGTLTAVSYTLAYDGAGAASRGASGLAGQRCDVAKGVWVEVADAGPLAGKVGALIAAAGHPSYETVAREIKAMNGPTVSAAYLWQLRTGARDNPTFHHLQALARYFSQKLGVPITLNYFDPQTPVDQPWRDAESAVGSDAPLDRRAQDERQLAGQLAERGIRKISARYGEMGPNMLRDILAIMDTLAAQDRQEPDATSESRVQAED
jgi:hypothetical protein